MLLSKVLAFFCVTLSLNFSATLQPTATTRLLVVNNFRKISNRKIFQTEISRWRFVFLGGSKFRYFISSSRRRLIFRRLGDDWHTAMTKARAWEQKNSLRLRQRQFVCFKNEFRVGYSLRDFYLLFSSEDSRSACVGRLLPEQFLGYFPSR